MSVFMDLNLTFTGDKDELRKLVETAAHLGYSTVAINYVFEPDTKKKTGRSQPIKILNRLTIMMSDSSHYVTSCPEYRHYDLLAVQPDTDKLFLSACMTYDIDLICLSVSDRLPFFYKRAPVFGALERGVAFEVSYSAAIRDSTRRRYTLANAMFHSDICKGKVQNDYRCPISIQTQLFGLTERCGKDAVTTNCRSVVLHGGKHEHSKYNKRLFRGT
uniref:Uncharacterized protein n=1 Tax=Periophthalmus magnuspinnatus TaxID=409849 RepID=A0A3B4ANJ3_9GOBI